MKQLQKIKLNIEGMHCNSCTVNIEDSLMDVEGIQSAKIILQSKSGIIEINKDKVSEEKIINAIKDAGYEASIVNE